VIGFGLLVAREMRDEGDHFFQRGEQARTRGDEAGVGFGFGAIAETGRHAAAAGAAQYLKRAMRKIAVFRDGPRSWRAL